MRLNTVEQDQDPSRFGLGGDFVAGGVWLLACLWLLVGCAGTGTHGEASRQDKRPVDDSAPGASASELGANKHFEEPGELDKLLDSKPMILAAVKPASQSQPGISSKAPEPVSKGRGNFRIQVGAESDVDAAQAKKAEYEKQLGGSVDVVFDAPYYKLRWGWFDSKQDAEDKILELTDFKIQGFVVKQ